MSTSTGSGMAQAGSSSGKPSAADAAWHSIREASNTPSEASTPLPQPTPDSLDDDGHHLSAPPPPYAAHSASDPLRHMRGRAESTSSSTGYWSGAPSRGPSSRGTTPPRKPLNIDAEDEDVKIAIMALGAMKNLDGHSRGSSEEKSSSSMIMDRPGQDIHGDIRSRSSASSMAGTDISAVSASSIDTTPLSTPTTLANLPPDFQFPAILQDEKGNEVRVDREMMKDAEFLRRVSHLPIVRGTLRAYEFGKQKSNLVRYGGDLVESGVKAISRPVVSRLGAHLGERGCEQLDDFACRQLDRIYKQEDRFTKEEQEQIEAELEHKVQTAWRGMSDEEVGKRKKAFLAQKLEDKDRALVQNELRQRKGKERAAVEEQEQSASNGSVTPATALVQTQSTSGYRPTSGWGSMLVEAGVTAGGLSAAVSEESMKSLKYCLHWLQYATAHIEHQISILRDLMVKLNHGELDMQAPGVQNLQSIKGDVVGTIRGVVDVVGKYAGGALPEPARSSVRGFILSLPARWANVNRAQVTGTPGSSFGGSPASPSFSSAHLSEGSSSPSAHVAGRPMSSPAARQAQMQRAATTQAANKVLTLAVESLDILRSVTVVFGESLDRADLWVERLRVLGIQRKRAHEHAAAEEAAHRIDAGMGGALGARGTWEDARGFGGSRANSPGAESNVSMATTASAKRRRVKGGSNPSNTRKSSSSPSHQTMPGSATWTMSSHDGDDDGHASSSSGIAMRSTSSHPGHGPSAASHRRKHRASSRVARTPSANSTPLLSELTLDSHASKKH